MRMEDLWNTGKILSRNTSIPQWETKMNCVIKKQDYSLFNRQNLNQAKRKEALKLNWRG